MLVTLCVLAAVLGIATALNLSLTFAVIRRVKDIEAGSGEGGRKLPPVGLSVGEFRAETVTGRPVARTDVAAGERFVGFVMVGCGPCAQLIESLDGDGGLLRTGGTEPLFFVVGEAGSEVIAAKLSAVGEVAVLADETEVAAAFGNVASYPTLLRLRDGVVTHAGHTLDGVGLSLPEGRPVRSRETV
ncbi:hypothetical protein [Streptomyces sp. RKAG293]|uniref:hypothetical protein n=1 Tax=Streptomyces sp. RKAG293 TaxID=2893403 RepID=UPI002033F1F3|nr:hypothetical protein [Streptomyces sp. RKAG293]MCM2420609.1 hypothetical protein [Streptomyces sp. RKAG293]